MSRYNPTHKVASIYHAADRWRKNSLIEDGSVFQDGENLWTATLIGELGKGLGTSHDDEDGDYLSKLQMQLSGCSSDCRKLMAEVMWLMMLFPTNIGAAKKRENIESIWSWSGEDLQATGNPFDGDVLNGIGSGGMGFNAFRWREANFLASALRVFKSFEAPIREGLASDPWEFSGWMGNLQGARNRQLTHMLPHLLFPDTFERICTERAKREILTAFPGTSFHGKPDREIQKRSTEEIDRALFDLRKDLEQERGEEIDFYEKDFLSQWKRKAKHWLLSWNPDKWHWEGFDAARAATIAGENVHIRWKCKSSKPAVGDRVFLTRTGKPPIGIMAAGKVTKASYLAEHRDKVRADGGETERFINVAFDSIRDADADEIVGSKVLAKREPNQEWSPQSSGIEIKSEPARMLERLWKKLPPAEFSDVVEHEDAGSPGGAPASARVKPPQNLILYGPPGTGKTYSIRTDHMPRYRGAEEENQNRDRFEVVTFHQNYAYEDFVEGIRPVPKDGSVTYEVKPGVLKRLCQRARKAPDRRFALFIDEINRGNVAKIFGELITLIEEDKRIWTDPEGRRLKSCKGLEVTLPYSGDTFGVPANLDVIATMNTADRSIALLDSALRRRFEFEELTPQPGLLRSIECEDGQTIELEELLRTINERMTCLLHRDQTLGHSYFMKVKSFSHLRRVFAVKILPFLQEAFYDDWRQVQYVLSDQAVVEELQLVRSRPQNAAELFPASREGEIGREIGNGLTFEVIREDAITPEAIRKIYERAE